MTTQPPEKALSKKLVWSRVLSSPTSERVGEIGAVVAVLAALVVYVSPTLGAPLLENHAFRQTQTAWTARESGGRDGVLQREQVRVLHEGFVDEIVERDFLACASAGLPA